MGRFPNFPLKKELVSIINRCNEIFFEAKYLFYKKTISPIKILSIDETIDYIIKNKCSISRFGDGEAKLISGEGIYFQQFDSNLKQRLIETIKEPSNFNYLICIPDIFSNLDTFTEYDLKHWKNHLVIRGKIWKKLLNKKKIYGNAFVSRCYCGQKNKKDAKKHFDKIKMIWKDKKILVVEGEFSRLGVGNDFFKECTEVKRILCPHKNAFSSYSQIYEESKKIPKDFLIIIALGPTATILAYDLSKIGYLTLDMGHIDIEYEWFLMGTQSKVKVPNKFIGEAIGGKIEEPCNDPKYKEEIIGRVC